MSTSVSRRQFVATAAAAGGALACAGIAQADEAAFDAEYDVVVLGMGFAGMVSAMSAADQGAKVLLAEKLPENEAGGNSRVCGQMFLNGNGNVEATRSYLEALCGTRKIPEDMLEFYSNGYANIVPVIERYSALDPADFMDTASLSPMLAAMSPEYPEFPGSESCGLWASHAGNSDAYLYWAVRDNLEANYADNIELWFDSPATSLIQDPETKAVLGVEIDNNGTPVRVRAKGGVVMALGGFENNLEMTQNYLNMVDYRVFGSLGNTGDGIKMCQAIGTKLWHMASAEGVGMSFATPEGTRGSMIMPLAGSGLCEGAMVAVGKEGRRFFNESEAPRHGKHSNRNGQWTLPAYPDGVHYVYDKNQYDAAVAIGLIPTELLDTFVECGTIDDAAAVIGCDAANLKETIDDYNFYVSQGKDYQCDRDPQTMRTFDSEPYYVARVYPIMLNTQGGPQRTVNGQVIDTDDQPIPGLYSAGEFGGVAPQMYQGGMNVGECFLMGETAGANAAKMALQA